MTSIARLVAPLFWRRVAVRGPDDCWPWTGARAGKMRYGCLWWADRVRVAHRVAWELTYGPIPPGVQVCHSCDNPPCCNPAHLFLGDNQENVADREAKGRTRGWGARKVAA